MSGIVITGIGARTPAGEGLDALWDSAREGMHRIAPIDRFDAQDYACPAAGQVDFDALDHLPSRFVKRTDRFTHLAVDATRRALADAGVTIGTDVAPERTGVMVGNVLGGWEFAERELRALWTDGPRAVSPYQATAWFPAAPQGNICIDQGIKGPARTFVADRASGAYALIGAAELLQRRGADLVIAGGVEAPLSPYGWLCLETSGLGAKSGAGAAAHELYRPFDAAHGGSVFAEGAVFLIMERRETAEARGAAVLGELAGWGVSSDGYMPYYTVEPTGQVLARAMSAAVARAGITGDELGAVFAHGSAVPFEDVTEGYALAEAFGTTTDALPVTAPKAGFGHLLGAAAPADAVLALAAMRAGLVPPTPGLTRPAPGIDLDLVRGTAREVVDWQHTLVVSRGLGGVNACLLLRS
ncbi:beta-ketoacyl-[acyl-carrier-protein] synthase family protein [Streptomyces triticagri]|uniref:Beta-ketoacyl-[acyl-carrier-protein] synthase family protein n=1 Tax=Streptomyces triticagri TaxID=2293568 RepID=A0A372M1E2_9ACTN|nr:beta-ketoacyl synthase N-terminal-like domain-containing protein [Streptomyces triticagri]RFU84711.1 beta-ketoacyl-[acyl-carrier-protein] synthase family protein [Streptomyces triticagri]